MLICMFKYMIFIGSFFSEKELEKGSCFYTAKISDIRCRIRIAGEEELAERHKLFKNKADQINSEKLKFFFSDKKINFGFSTRKYRFSINDTSR
jgi:hypothetical protein